MDLSVISSYLKFTALSFKRLSHKFPETERMWMYFHGKGPEEGFSFVSEPWCRVSHL